MKLKSFVLGLLFSFLLFSYPVIAADNGNGVDVTIRNYDAVYLVHAEWFQGYDPDSTSFVYNESDESIFTSGELDTSFIFDKGNVIVSVPTYGGSLMTIRIEGKTEDATVWATVIEQEYDAATTIAEGFPITSYWDAVRIGVKVAGTAVDSLTIEADFMTQKAGGQ